ncbi:MAG: hypothetical protein CMF62_00260 [Magnetococcales bacterium]|nr:hypothetical protein [Magnetococcales bacterium]
MTLYQDEFDEDIIFFRISEKLLSYNLSIDERLELITEEICQMLTDNGKTFLMYLFADVHTTYETCFYLKAIRLTTYADINHRYMMMNVITLAFKNYNENDEVLLELLKKGDNINYYCYHRTTPLMYALINCKNEEILLEILNQKPNLNIITRSKHTTIMFAFQYCNHKNILLELLRQELDLNIQNHLKKSATIYAFQYCDDKDVLLELLRQEPDLNIKDYMDNTATKYAFQYCDDKDVLLELLRQEPDLTPKDYFGKSILDYAFSHYVNKSEFDFGILEKLYNGSSEQDKKKYNANYLKLRNKYKVLPLILFRLQKYK